jgi:transcriptional regulator with XRE-family HTH domain
MMFSVSRVLPAATAKLVKRKHGSIAKLAAAVGVQPSTVSRTLRGELRGEETQIKIAKALGVSRPKLFGKAA